MFVIHWRPLLLPAWCFLLEYPFRPRRSPKNTQMQSLGHLSRIAEGIIFKSCRLSNGHSVMISSRQQSSRNRDRNHNKLHHRWRFLTHAHLLHSDRSRSRSLLAVFELRSAPPVHTRRDLTVTAPQVRRSNGRESAKSKRLGTATSTTGLTTLPWPATNGD